MDVPHTRKRGKQYHYVCRVPSDLQILFPVSQITQSLKTSNEKDAKIAASALEYRTQQLFLQLRTRMLPKELEKQLVAEYMSQLMFRLENAANGELLDSEQRQIAHAVASGCTRDEAQANIAARYDDKAAFFKSSLARAEGVSPDSFPIKVLEAAVKKRHNLKLSAEDRKQLALKLTNANKQMNEAHAAILRGEWSLFEKLQQEIERDLSNPYHDLVSVVGKYKDWYLTAKHDRKQGTKDDMVSECRTLIEIFGNVGIADFNTMDSVTKLQKTLLRYPKNKVKKFGDKSIHAILKERLQYEVMNPKTANNIIDRAKSIVTYAAKCKLLNATNVYEGARLAVSKAADKERSAYDTADIQRLVEAICTQDLYSYGDPRPERFWIILIVLFHGLRLGNILALTKEDICQTDQGTWVFMLREGKTAATVGAVAICDTLMLLGFLDWVESLPRKKLFQDTTKTFSPWYNRNELQKNGKPSLGFEARHVTTDRKKCFYSLRHSFAGEVFKVTGDYKITADMLRHSTGSSVTARYIKATKAEALKETTEKMRIEHIDLDRLEARAQELFFT